MAAATAAGLGTNVFPFRDARAAPDPVLEAGPVAHGSLPVPLVLDNGSFQARAGWACPGPDPGPESGTVSPFRAEQGTSLETPSPLPSPFAFNLSQHQGLFQ